MMINGQLFVIMESLFQNFIVYLFPKKYISYVLSDSFLLLLFGYNFIVYNIYVNYKIVILYCDLSEKRHYCLFVSLFLTILKLN